MNSDIRAILFAGEHNADTPSLDIHGYDAHTAIKEVEDFLGRMSGRKCPVVKIICGHGAGHLHTRLREFLKKPHPQILGWSHAVQHPQQAGAVYYIALH